MILLSGCGRTIRTENIDSYRVKQLIASSFTNLKNFNENNINKSKLERFSLIWTAQQTSMDDLVKSTKTMRKLAFAWGEGDIKYHIVLPGDTDRFLFQTFSATTMTTYNISYIINLPAKLIANVRTNFSLGELKSNNLIENIVVTGSALKFTVLDIIYAIIGVLLAIIMLPVGLILGLITSPLQTFFDIIPSILGLIKTIFYAFSNLFY